jgi:hypothetical protein
MSLVCRAAVEKMLRNGQHDILVRRFILKHVEYKMLILQITVHVVFIHVSLMVVYRKNVKI